MLRVFLSVLVFINVLFADYEGYKWDTCDYSWGMINGKSVMENYHPKLKDFQSDVVVGVVDKGLSKTVDGKTEFDSRIVDNLWTILMKN
jgi:hypothetical protein